MNPRDNSSISRDEKAAFFDAAENNDMDTVVDFLETYKKHPSTLNIGRTALLGAARNGHYHIVKKLVDTGVSINNYKEMTPLMMATINGHLDVVKLLVEKKANVNYATAKGETALYLAAKTGQSSIFHYLIKHGADINYRRASDGATLLHVALSNQYPEIAMTLIDSGADINAVRTSDRMSLLHLALITDSMDVVKSLLTKGNLLLQNLAIKIGADVVASLIKGDYRFTNLNLQNKSLDNNDIIALSGCLVLNLQIQRLDLTNNQFYLAGLLQLCNAMNVNKSLEYLVIDAGGNDWLWNWSGRILLSKVTDNRSKNSQARNALTTIFQLLRYHQSDKQDDDDVRLTVFEYLPLFIAPYVIRGITEDYNIADHPDYQLAYKQHCRIINTRKQKNDGLSLFSNNSSANQALSHENNVNIRKSY